MNTCFIYGITLNGELIYIGKAKDVLKRFKQHLQDKSASRKARALQAADRSKLEVFVIEEVPEQEYKAAENFWQQYFTALGCNLLCVIAGSPTSRKQKSLAGKVRATAFTSDYQSAVAKAGQAKKSPEDKSRWGKTALEKRNQLYDYATRAAWGRAGARAARHRPATN